MAMLEAVRNGAIGIAVMVLIPTIIYVGTRLVMTDPKYPNYSKLAPDSKEREDVTTQYEKEKDAFNKVYSCVSAVCGLLAIIIGAFFIPIPFLGTGFILGGTFSLVTGYYYYWDNMNDIVKFVSLIAALIVLIVSSFKFIRPKKA